jgi:hypothetical protein
VRFGEGKFEKLTSKKISELIDLDFPADNVCLLWSQTRPKFNYRWIPTKVGIQIKLTVDAYWRQQHVCASLRAPGGYEVFVPFRNFVSLDSLDWSGLTFHCVPFLSPPIRKPSQTQTLWPIGLAPWTVTL